MVEQYFHLESCCIVNDQKSVPDKTVIGSLLMVKVFFVYFTVLYYVASNAILLTQHYSSNIRKMRTNGSHVTTQKPCYQKHTTSNNRCNHELKERFKDDINETFLNYEIILCFTHDFHKQQRRAVCICPKKLSFFSK